MEIVLACSAESIQAGNNSYSISVRPLKYSGNISLLSHVLNSSIPSVNKDQNIRENTTLGIIATNLCLDKSQTNKLAERGQDGFAMAIQPCHMPGDGDVVFSISTSDSNLSIDRSIITSLYALAPIVMSEAIMRGVKLASSLGGIPTSNDLDLL